ncbi:MAG: D-alanyl-D-alanine carboxypeptidase family protein [Steroidobacteraceae bacterium]
MPRSPVPSALAAAALPVLAALAGAAPAAVVPVPVPPPPALPAHSYVLLDFNTGQVLAQKNPDDKLPMASLTKLMTAYIVFSALKSGQLTLDTPVTISKAAWRTGGSRMFLNPGSQVTVLNLLKGMIVESGNDATVALAQKVGGTQAGFVTLMNDYARRLGLNSTHYEDVDGLPKPDHFTTARDLATLAADIIRDFPQYYFIFKIKQFTWDHITQRNRVSLLWTDPSVDGMKTGFTDAAGYCMVTSADRNGMRVVSVVLGAPSWNGRVQDSEALINYGFNFYENENVAAARAIVARPRVYKSADGTAAVGPAQAIVLTVPRGPDATLSTRIVWNHWPLEAPLAAGAAVGTLIVTNGAGQQVVSAPLVTLGPVPEGSLFTRLADEVRLWF